MSYTSITFLIFAAVVAAGYYLFPVKKYQWTVLLAASVFFYLYASFKYSFYLLITLCSTYAGTMAMDRITVSRKAVMTEHKSDWSKDERKAYKKETEKITGRISTAVLVINFGILAFLKYFSFTVQSLGGLLGIPALGNVTLNLVLPLGISFYTFQSMGYVIDVSRGTVEVQKNFGKLALFMSFFPQIIQGPIGIYSHLAGQLYEQRSFSYDKFRMGIELMLWGFIKKLVIADRAYGAIAVVTGEYTAFNGSVLSFTTLLYALQLYADFSGGVDISRGVAQILGIDMAENFKRPYFAVSVNDFWRRWHITLGAWMKNYLFYPLAISGTARKLTAFVGNSKFGGTKAGQHLAKTMPSCLATMVVFLIVGIWHGAGSRYIGYGLWNAVIITLAILLEPVFRWQNARLGIHEDSIGIHIFRIVRTFILILISFVTDLAPTLSACFDWTGRCIADFSLRTGIVQIEQSLGFKTSDYIILLCGTVLLFAVSLLQEKIPGLVVREKINSMRLPARWLILMAGLVTVLIFGQYGPGYDSAAFVYMQF